MITCTMPSDGGLLTTIELVPEQKKQGRCGERVCMPWNALSQFKQTSTLR